MDSRKNFRKNQNGNRSWNQGAGQNKKRGGAIKKILPIILLLLAYFLYALVNAKKTIHPEELGKRTDAQETALEKKLDQKYPERTSVVLTGNPFAADTDDIDLNAESAILIDTTTGEIIYEKDADEQIPPASMTKIVEMYVVFDAIEKGLASMDDIVPLPPESWEINIPWDASRMHLAKGQTVTLRELLLGLAICSGNDASIAVANYISGSMEDFVMEMNKAVASMGLTKTVFVESSGYSEENLTTAREFATFARQYIKRFPKALEQFHSQKEIRYPLKNNVPEGTEPETYRQQNTNKLLDEIAGCDGLKTGYIDESGYNISVTAQRNGVRFLSVTMGGPGDSLIIGNRYRVADNKELFDFAFDNFTDYHVPKNSETHEYTVGVFGAKEKSVKLVPAMDETFTVPMTIASQDGSEEVSMITTQVSIPKYIYGGAECGAKYGEITYFLNGKPFRTLPLVADRNVEKGNIFQRFIGKSSAIVADIFRSL